MSKTDVNLLSQGGYGCVYHPSLDCKARNSNNKNKITKLQISKQDVENELGIGNALKNIRKHENHFGTLDKSCQDLSLKQIEQTGLLKECELKESDTYILTDMRYIQGDTLKNYLYKIKSPEIICYKMIEIYRQLIISVEKMQNASVIHNDLKSSNIMFDVMKQLPIIIDFGISFFSNRWRGNLKHIFFSYEPRYMLMAPEIHFLSYLLHMDKEKLKEFNQDKNKVCERIATEIVHNISVFHVSFSKSFRQKYLQNLIKYFQEVIVDFQPDKENAETFYTKHYEPICNTWDIYSISIMYFQLLENVFQNRFPKVEFLEKMTHHLFLNMHPDPRKRRTTKQVLKEYNVFLTQHKIRDVFIESSRFAKHKYYDKQLLEMVKQERISEKLSEEIKESRRVNKV